MRDNLKIAVLAVLLSTFGFQFSAVFADTIMARDGRQMKGIVVEDYDDRVVFSTIDGEVTVMKSDISVIYYDNEDDNLVKLAEKARDEHNYDRSYAFYNMALKKNPDSKAAKDGVVFLQGFLFRKEEVKKQEDIKRREEFERYGVAMLTEKKEEDVFGESLGKLKDNMGFVLGSEDAMPVIESVQASSPAATAGLKKGDAIVSIWGRLTGYTPLKDVVATLLEKPSLEIKCGIVRTVVVDINPGIRMIRGINGLIGASFKMEFDGLAVSDVKDGGPAMRAGVKKGDLVIAIDGRPTRYMPLKKAIGYIKDTENDFVKLTIKRDVVIWRRA